MYRNTAVNKVYSGNYHACYLAGKLKKCMWLFETLMLSFIQYNGKSPEDKQITSPVRGAADLHEWTLLFITTFHVISSEMWSRKSGLHHENRGYLGIFIFHWDLFTIVTIGKPKVTGFTVADSVSGLYRLDKQYDYLGLLIASVCPLMLLSTVMNANPAFPVIIFVL